MLKIDILAINKHKIRIVNTPKNVRLPAEILGLIEKDIVILKAKNTQTRRTITSPISDKKT